MNHPDQSSDQAGKGGARRAPGYKIRTDILRRRRKVVQWYPDLIRDDYQPCQAVFGKSNAGVLPGGAGIKAGVQRMEPANLLLADTDDRRLKRIMKVTCICVLWLPGERC